MYFILEQINGAWHIMNSHEPIATKQEAETRIEKVLKRDSERIFTLVEMKGQYSACTSIQKVEF